MFQRQHNDDRMRRAESWQRRCQATSNDDRFSDYDRFIFLWIAFNAAYGSEPYGLAVDISDTGGEQKTWEGERIHRFLNTALAADSRKHISNLLWYDLAGPIGELLNNRYVHPVFWESVRQRLQGRARPVPWRQEFRDDKSDIEQWLKDRTNAIDVPWHVLHRLYTLRNQILHGGATYGKGKGRGQVRLGATIMASVVPAILAVMKEDIDEHPDSEAWGIVRYPTVSGSGRVVPKWRSKRTPF